MCRCGSKDWECACDPNARLQENKPKPHKHAALIKAWADGVSIEHYNTMDKTWYDCPFPSWIDSHPYRIKPTPKPDLIVNTLMRFNHSWKSPHINLSWNGDETPDGYKHNSLLDVQHIKYTFDGETGELKSVELIK